MKVNEILLVSAFKECRSSLFLPVTVNKPPYPQRVISFEFRRQQRVGKVLVAHGSGESVYSAGSDRSRSAICGSRKGPAMNHRVTNFYAGRVTVNDKPSDFLLKNRYEICIFRKVLIGAV